MNTTADTIRQMMADWNAASPEQREAAMRTAALAAALVEFSLRTEGVSNV